MLNIAQTYSYNQQYQREEQLQRRVEDIDLSMYNFGDIARNWQNGLAGTKPSRTESSESASTFSSASFTASSAGTKTESGFASDFNFRKYGEDKDAESYTSDADKEKPVDEKKSNIAMGIDLDKLEELKSRGFSAEQISKSLRYMNSYSVDEMEENFNKTGELTPEAAAGKDIEQDAMKQYARDFQLAMQVPEHLQEKEGVGATMAGAKQTLDIGIGATRAAIA